MSGICGWAGRADPGIRRLLPGQVLGQVLGDR